MQTDTVTVRKSLSEDLMEVMVRIGLIAFLVIICVRIFAPFSAIVLWAVILAVALYPLHQRLAGYLGGRQGSAATLVVLMGLLLIGSPLVMLGSSFANRVYDAYQAFERHTISIGQPNPAVADWPLVGERLYTAWSSAANDLPAYLQENEAQLKNLSKRAFSVAASTAGAVFVFLGSLIIAGIMMAYGESAAHAMQRIFNRLRGPVKGPQMQRLSTATVRSVAAGVIGVALIQALLLGIGFIMAGVPAAGLLALGVMFIGIMQLPALIVSLPVIAWLWWGGDASTASNTLYTIYLLLAGAADNVLKPLLLGRGVDAPMPVILIGALGGMVSGGIIGLFLGAVLLAVGYKLFMEWVDDTEAVTAVEPGPVETGG